MSTSCSDYSSPTIYWVYESVLSLHNKLSTVYNHMTSTGLLDGLRFDQIQHEYADSFPDQSNWKLWVSAAFRLASASSGEGFMFGAILDAFAMANPAGGGIKVYTSSAPNALASTIRGAANELC